MMWYKYQQACDIVTCDVSEKHVVYIRVHEYLTVRAFDRWESSVRSSSTNINIILALSLEVLSLLIIKIYVPSKKGWTPIQGM